MSYFEIKEQLVNYHYLTLKLVFFCSTETEATNTTGGH